MKPHSDKAIWFVIFILVLFFAGNFIFTQYEILQIKNILIKPTPSPIIYTLQITPSPEPKPIATASFSPTPTSNPSQIATLAPKPTQITYIPLNGGSTQNTDWVNIASSQFSLNITDYGAKAYAIWDANLRVDNANGTTYARLFDTTHSIAVNGSEISLTDQSQSTNITSGSLSFWAGNNTYVIQIKSLNSSTAFVDNGRIKITY